MMEWQVGIDEFLDYLKNERKSSINTVMAYRNDLRQFAAYLQKNLPASATWQDLQRESIEDYSREISGSGYTPATIARKVAALKTLLNWLQHNGRAQEGLIAALKSPRVEKRVPRVLSEEQVQSLFDATSRMPAPRSLRDRALLELIYSTGMRVTEAISFCRRWIWKARSPPPKAAAHASAARR
jgi:integrase/recombinase XerD